MRTIMMTAAALLAFSAAAYTGGRPAAPVTGNPGVDFFGLGSSGAPAGGRISLVPLRQEGEGGGTGEKSPWLAAALSLAVPGAGEVYAGSYIKGAAFFAAEAALWGFAYSYDKQGDDLTEEYKRYADSYWSATRYIDWTLQHIGSLNPGLTTGADDYRALIYPGDDPPCDPPFSCVNWQALNAMEDSIRQRVGNGYTHELPYYGEQQYYELIGKYDQFSRGWDDSGVLNPELDGAVPIQSTSQRFFDYARMRARANDKYDIASTFVNIVVVNHVLSAIDAFWSVTKLNKSLHASVRVKMEKSPLGSVPVTTANFRYDF